MTTAHVGTDPRWYESNIEYTKSKNGTYTMHSTTGQLIGVSGTYKGSKKRWRESSTVKKVVQTDPLTGKSYTLYKTLGYDDFIGHYARNDEDALHYALAAFDDKNIAEGAVASAECAEGHIARLRFAYKQHIMEVTFRDGTECFFYNVPAPIGSTLIAHAIRGSTRIDKKGVVRHLVGIRFWDLIRIRGQLYGARYEFTYGRRSDYKLTGNRRRYIVKLTKDNMEYLLGKNYKGPLKPGDYYATVLAGKDLGKVDPKMIVSGMGDAVFAANDNTSSYTASDDLDYSSYDDGKLHKSYKQSWEDLSPDSYGQYDPAFDRILDELAATQDGRKLDAGTDSIGASEQAATSGALTPAESKRFNDYLKRISDESARMNDARSIAKQKATNMTENKIAEYERRYLEAGNPDPLNRTMTKQMYSYMTEKMPGLQQALDWRHTSDSNVHTKASYGDKPGKYYGDVEVGQRGQSRNTWQRNRDLFTDREWSDFKYLYGKVNPNVVARHLGARVWTVRDLKNVLVSSQNDMSPNEMYEYKVYLKTGRYHEALNMLKNINHNTYVNGRRVNDKQEKIAGNKDMFVSDSDIETGVVE